MKFDRELLLSNIEKMTREKRIAFGASCCERLLPNYKKFTETENWGDYSLMRNILDKIWGHVLNNPISEVRIKQMMEECNNMTPDSEDFSSIYTSFAIDAGGAIHETLNCCLDSKSEHIVDVASFARDSVDMFIQERDNMDYSEINFEEKILNDFLMQNELQRQEREVELLMNQNILNEQFINNVLIVDKGKSNLEI